MVLNTAILYVSCCCESGQLSCEVTVGVIRDAVTIRMPDVRIYVLQVLI